MIGIYKITNGINCKAYIGCSYSVESRFKDHLKNLNKSKHINSELQKDYNYYGSKNFTFDIIEEVQSVRDLKNGNYIFN